MTKIIKSISLVALLGTFLLLGWYAYFEMQDGFLISNIVLQEPFVSPIDSVCSKNSNEIQKALLQPYIYSTKGRQFYCFISQDRKYMLKFFKCQRLELAFYHRIFCSEKSVKEKIAYRKDRQKRLVESCILASQNIPEETGVLYAHLNTTDTLNTIVQINDKLGFTHKIHLDRVPFILQYAGKPIVKELLTLLKEKKMDLLNKRALQVVELFIRRAKKGVFDVDQGFILRDNIGFLDDAAIHLDIGTFYEDTQDNAKKHLKEEFEAIAPLREWLKENAKDTHLQVELAIQKAMKEISS